jgi:hypothetical protein
LFNERIRKKTMSLAHSASGELVQRIFQADRANVTRARSIGYAWFRCSWRQHVETRFDVAADLPPAKRVLEPEILQRIADAGSRQNVP